MLFGKLLPTEGNFFVMFNQHADRIVEAAHAFSNLVANYGDPILRDKYNSEVDNAERGADRAQRVVDGARVGVVGEDGQQAFADAAVAHLGDKVTLKILPAATSP